MRELAPQNVFVATRKVSRPLTIAYSDYAIASAVLIIQTSVQSKNRQEQIYCSCRFHSTYEIWVQTSVLYQRLNRK